MSIDIKSITYKISNGPNRDVIIDAFKYAYETKIPLKFTITKFHPELLDHPEYVVYELETKNIRITSIEHESGTGYHLNLAGFIDAKTDNDWHPFRFEAFYNANTRKGHIKLIK